MFWLVILGAVFAALHFYLLLPVQLAIVAAVVVAGLLWILWKARWVVLGILGLEMLFGSGGDGDA